MPLLLPWTETVCWKSLETYILVENKHQAPREWRGKMRKRQAVHMNDRTVPLTDCFSLFVWLETNNIVAHMLGHSHFLFYLSLGEPLFMQLIPLPARHCPLWVTRNMTLFALPSGAFCQHMHYNQVIQKLDILNLVKIIGLLVKF